jgi:tetrahydromethanopterin S-methyltransferase subunit A
VDVKPVVGPIPAADLVGRKDVERLIAVGSDPQRIKLDKAGYFVIHIEDDVLVVEHYNYKEELIRVIESRDARSIYLTLIRNGWVSELDHAAYLGKELARAQWSVEHHLDFVQDGA